MSPLQKNLKKKQGTERNRREIKIRKIMTDEQTIPLKVLVPEQGKKEYAQPYVTSWLHHIVVNYCKWMYIFLFYARTKSI